MASSPFSKNAIIKHDSFTATTGAATGFYISDIPTSVKIINAYSGSLPVITWTYDGCWVFGLISSTSGTLSFSKNTQVTFEYDYYE